MIGGIPIGKLSMDDETFTLLELKRLFEAIKDGQIKKIVFNEYPKQKEFEIRSVTLCKDCIHFNADNIPEEGCGFCELLSRTYESEHFCADGERKDGEHGG